MPEGPEVKTITNDLNNMLKNSILERIEIVGGRYKNGIDKYDDFSKKIPEERTIQKVNCKGKFIWFEFNSNWSLWCTLGMSGGFTLEYSKHCDLKFVTTKGNIWFRDQRHFGTIKFCNEPKNLEKKLISIGPDILSDLNFTLKQFLDIIKKYPDKTLPKILMDQSKISGIGNYLKSEILYYSKISPFRKIKNISNKELEIVFKYSKEISLKSYKSGGATIRNYSDINNVDGKFIFEFKVYSKKVDDNMYNIIKSKTDDGRTTHWVPEIQK